MSISLWPDSYKRSAMDIFPRESLQHEINLRQEFEDILDGTPSDPQRGHWVLLYRMETRQRCSCWNERGVGEFQYAIDKRKYDEPDKDCEVCNGLGWIYAEELHKIRRRVISRVTTLGGMEEQTEFGIMSVPYVAFYFKYYVNPADRDRIVEIANDKNGNPIRPFQKSDIYNITIAEPFRDIGGRIEYWRCATKKQELRNG